MNSGESRGQSAPGPGRHLRAPLGGPKILGGRAAPGAAFGGADMPPSPCVLRGSHTLRVVSALLLRSALPQMP